ncbi:MAG: hypothetical protein ACKOCJ_07655 [Burkholderiaceae bacterium]
MAKARNLLNHPLAEGVRRHGFRKWYERELLSGHAHMVLCLLACIAMLASFEAMSGSTTAEKLLDMAFVAVSALIGVWSLRRYLYLLMHAEEVANQANCPRCEEYGRFEVTGEDRQERSVQVRCRKCASDWLIHE